MVRQALFPAAVAAFQDMLLRAPAVADQQLLQRLTLCAGDAAAAAVP